MADYIPQNDADMNVWQGNLVEIIEVTFVFLASKNVKTTGIAYQLREIPVNKRQHKFMKYSFWMPVGKEGYYCQK